MIKEFEYEGEWWLPEQPERKIKGTLRFTPRKGAFLHLIGSKQDFEMIWQAGEIEIMQGFSTDGKKLTLHKCFPGKLNVHYPGMAKCLLHITYVFVGAHFQNAKDIEFRSLRVRFSYLDDWVDISGLKMKYYKKGATIRYKHPKEFHAKISKGLRVRIGVRAEYPVMTRVQKEAGIKQEAFVEIKPSEARHFEELLDLAFQIRNFLTLAIMEPVYLLSCEGKTEFSKIKLEGKEIFPPVSVFYKLQNIPEPAKSPTPLDMLFTLSNISRKFDYFVKNWFRKRELLKPVSDLYFGTLYQPRMYLNNEFLNLVQAIESYHRRTMLNYELPEDQHQKRIAEILSAAPDEHREWLDKRLKYSNEPTLRKRLKDILEYCPEVINKVIRNRRSFINKTVVTRHFWTHFDPDLRDHAAKNGELFYLVSRLRILLQSCLLKELGFSSESLEKLILSLIHKRYRFLQGAS